MNVSNAKKLIRGIAEKNVPISLLLVGAMGIGKSQIVKQVADELGYNIIDLRLAQLEPGDLIGIPYREGNVTKWAQPEWWPEEGSKGILFLDELNRAPADVRQAIFQLVLDRHLHTHKLPNDWPIVAAINPENGNYQVETLGPAMVRRFCVVPVTPDAETWLAWAHKAGRIQEEITSFIAAHKQMLHVQESAELPTVRNPGGWENVSIVRASGILFPEIENEVYSGLIGSEGAVAFRKFLDSNYARPVTGREVLTNYESVHERVVAQRSDENYSTIIDLIAMLQDLKKLSKKQTENICGFIQDLPDDSKASLIDKFPKLLFGNLLAKNKVVSDIFKILNQAK